MAEEKEDENKVSEPLAIYKSAKVTFAEVEDQWDIQLKHALSISPIERLAIMRQLTDRAFGITPNTTGLKLKGAKIILGSYEYIP